MNLHSPSIYILDYFFTFYDRRDLKQCAIKIVGDKCHDVWTVTTKDNQICAGYSNGDIRMFDIRTTDKVTWETNFGAGMPLRCT